MRFSAKVILSEHRKMDGCRAVYVQAYINRQRALVNLGFYINEKYFDHEKGVIKPSAPNSELMNYQIAEALTRANKIYLDFRYSNRFLTPQSFRAEFEDPAEKMDFVNFMEKEIELRKLKLEPATHSAHVTTLNKLKKFKARIYFHELTVELLQRFENFIIKEFKIKENTVHKVFRIIKVYVHEAERKEIRFKNPFKDYSVKSTQPLKPTLSFEEVQRLFAYYNSDEALPSHKKLLRYFLFSCTTGVRISDIGLLEWNNLHGNTLVFLPYKTRKRNRFISIPLSDIHLGLIGQKGESKYLFDCFAKAVTNRMLKDIAKIKSVDIKKHLTYHISRHTFGTEFLDRGGQLDTLQQLMGHSMITTTMQYTKVKEGRKRDELSKAFDELKAQNPD